VAEVITVLANGQPFTGTFKNFEVDAGYHHAAHSFSFEVAPSAQRLQIFAPGTPLQIQFNNDVAFTGYVDRLQPTFKKLTISGRSKSQDFIDCAAIDPGGTGNFQNQSPLAIAQALAQPFGVTVATDQQLDDVESYQLVPGESGFAACEKLTRAQGLTLSGQYDGSLKLTKPGSKRHAGGLYQGQAPLKDLEGDLNWAHRHSPIIVRGQSASGTDAAALQVEATAQDASVWGGGAAPVQSAPSSSAPGFTTGRYRPLVHVEDSDIDSETAQSLADAHSQREAGEALKAHAVTYGFRDSGGTLWTPGWLVWVESERIGLCQALLIKKIKFTQKRGGAGSGKHASKGGSTAHLELVDPRAYGGTAAKGSSPPGSAASSIWKVGTPPVPFAPGSVPG